LEGFILGVSCLSASLPGAGFPWANETIEKSKQLRLKTATNIDLKLFDTIPTPKFAANIRPERQSMKITLKKGGWTGDEIWWNSRKREQIKLVNGTYWSLSI